jgi:sigma54-dependent transcription regulator
LEASPTEEEEVLRRGETILYRQNLLASCWFILVGRRYDPRERKRKKKLQQQKSQRNDIMASLSLSFYSARAGRLKKRSEIVHIKPNGIFY